MICNCQDFLRIQFCKHVAAIHLHFPYLCFQKSNPIMSLENLLSLDRGEEDSNSNSRSEAGSESTPESVLTPKEILQIHTLIQEINSLSHSLTSKKIDRSHYPVVIEAIWSAKYSLASAGTSVEGTSTLPVKDLIAPNQNSWSETATSIGHQAAPKVKMPPQRVQVDRTDDWCHSQVLPH